MNFTHRRQYHEQWYPILEALPHPAAVFHAGSGTVFVANHHFHAAFGSETDKGIVSTLTEDGTGGRPPSVGPFVDADKGMCISVVRDGAIRVDTPSGAHPPVEASVKPIKVDGIGCQLVIVPMACEQQCRDNGSWIGISDVRTGRICRIGLHSGFS